MHVAVLIESRSYTARTARGRYVRAGRCPVCRDALLVLVPVRDDDAVCDSCGAVVGRVILHARADGGGGVVRTDDEPERWDEAASSEVARGVR